jgi:biotin synthase
VITATKKAAEKDPFIQRVCISAITSPRSPKDLVKMVKEVKEGTGLKVSTLITPTVFEREDFEAIKAAGAENITVAVDAATPELFDRLRGKRARGPHKWDRYLKGIKEAVEVLGNGTNAVGVHLIIGLGETEEEAVRFIQSCYDNGARVHLFSFYPEKGVAMEDMSQPPLEQYRRVQLARHLIDRGKSRFEKMTFDAGRLTAFGLSKNGILEAIRKGTPFMTTGCTGCNRPYANETPTQAMQGLFRNYPFPPNTQDLQTIEKQMGIRI